MPSSEPRPELVMSSRTGMRWLRDIVSQELLMIWLAVAVGGALGSMARHGVNILFAHALPRPVPYATATVNLVGSAVIGLLAALVATGRLQMSAEVRTFVFVGILGGFTTF